MRFTISSVQRPVRETSARILGPALAAISDDAFDKRDTPPRLAEHRFGAVAILDIGSVDIDVQQQAQRADNDVALAADDLLPGIEAGWIKRAPPVREPLALCASRIAVVGQASRPARSRIST